MKKIQLLVLCFSLFAGISAHSQRHFDSTEFRNLRDYTGISASLAANIHLIQSDSFSFKIVGRTRQLERVESFVKDGILRIRMEHDYDVFKDLERVHIYISAPTFQDLTFSGVGRVESETKLTGTKLFIKHSGVHNIDLDVDCKELKAEMSGVGSIYLKGKSANAAFEMSGTGSIDAYNLTVQDVDCSVSGLGDIQCYAENNLKANVSGLGSVKYKGEPKNFKKSISGLGRVVSR